MSNADESVTRFAQRHRLRAAAALVQIVNDEDASASARVAASQSILAYSDGKPGVTKHITPSDVMAMTTEERHSLWRALFEVETDFPAFIVDRITDTVQREARRLSTAKTNRFTRGQPEPRPPHVIPSRNAAIETPAVARERRADAGGTSTTPMPATGSEAAPVAASPAASPAESSTPAGNSTLNGHAFDPANFSNSDYDPLTCAPRHRIGFGDPAPGLGIAMRPGATNGANGRGRA